jgi:hypothetical protein
VSATLSYEEAECFKKPIFWDKMQAFDWTFPANVDAELVAVGGVVPASSRGSRKSAENPRTSSQQNDLARCLELGAEDWLKIAAWGRETGTIEAWKLGLVTTLASYAAQGRKELSVKQVTHAADLVAKAREAGIL